MSDNPEQNGVRMASMPYDSPTTTTVAETLLQEILDNVMDTFNDDATAVGGHKDVVSTDWTHDPADPAFIIVKSLHGVDFQTPLRFRLSLELQS